MGRFGARAVLIASTTAVFFLSGTAVSQAASPPNVVGQKYSDAQTTITGAGLKAVVSTVVGDLKARADCLVVNQVARTVPPPENSSGSATNQLLVSLNCDDDVASAKTQGFSAVSPEGMAAKAAKEKAAKDKEAVPAAS